MRDLVFFFTDPATTAIYPLSLHDALPISWILSTLVTVCRAPYSFSIRWGRSEEHTSELQSRLHLVCRLLLEKKKTSRPLCFSRIAGAVQSFSSTTTCFSRGSRSAVHATEL